MNRRLQVPGIEEALRRDLGDAVMAKMSDGDPKRRRGDKPGGNRRLFDHAGRAR